MRKLSILISVLLFGLSAPVHSEWYRAESDHFVIYADDREKDVREFGEALERYHDAMVFVTGTTDVVPSPSNRVTIFVVGGERDIKDLYGDRKSNVLGFYKPRAGASRAFVPDIRMSNRDLPISMIVLLHEYAHHFMMSSAGFAMPRWHNEGVAEFFASARFDSDGSVWLGRPAQHRAGEFAFAEQVTVEELLDHELYEKRKKSDNDEFYGKSWALYHYLVFEPERQGQLKTYIGAIASGMTDIAAAKKAFGDLDALNKEVIRYLRNRRMFTFKIRPDMLPEVAVKVTPLAPGESAVMPLRIRSQNGVTREMALEIVPQVREIAARYPDDAGVLTALAEAEFDAGFPDAAIAAADRAIAIDRTRANAYVQKGYAFFREAQGAPAAQKEKAFSAAMQPFQALNRIENDHPLPLIYFYRTFQEQGREPTELARHALERASELSPFDQTLTFQTAMMQAEEGKISVARANLGRVAADPHGGKTAALARQFQIALLSQEEGKPWRPTALTGAIADIAATDLTGDQ